MSRWMAEDLKVWLEYFFRQTTDYEDSCSSCEHLTKRNLKQEDFNDYLDKVIYGDESIILSPDTAVLARWVYEQNGYDFRHKVYTWTQRNKLPPTKVILT